jgi:hypothetical protein
MNNWLRLGIPVVLGLVAAGVNYTVMQHQVEPLKFLSVTRDVEPGETLAPEDLAEVTVSGEVATLAKAAIQAQDRSLLMQRTVARRLKRNDLLLYSDVTNPAELKLEPGEASLGVSLGDVAIVPRLLLVGEEIGFLVNMRGTAVEPAATAGDGDPPPAGGPRAADVTYLGPFRLLSVGERISRVQTEKVTSGNDRDICIAVPLSKETGQMSDTARRLVSAMAGNESGRSAIVAVVLHGNTQNRAGAAKGATSGDGAAKDKPSSES